jgi:hypothetical protein
MSRKPVDTVQLKVRIRESLRKKLADDAKKRRLSLNKVIGERLEESFQLQSLAASAASLSTSATLLQSIARVLDRVVGEFVGRHNDDLRS